MKSLLSLLFTKRPLTTLLALAASSCAWLLAPARAGAQTNAPPGVTLVRVASGLTAPLFATAPPGDTQRLFIVEQGSGGSASIKILNLATGAVDAQPFLTLTGLVTAGEQGLLGLAFRADYATSGKFYVDYITPGGAFGSGIVTIAEFKVSSSNPNVADPNSKRIVLTQDKPQTNHNGGWIGFSPRAGDGNNLYIAIGDGGAGNDQGTGHIEPGGNAQNLTTLLGKILRINVAATGGAGGTAGYAIPADNPFVSTTSARPEIFVYGLRNPFRNSFDRATGDLFIGDVGQGTREEIDVQRASNPRGGENYGWRLREGTVATPGVGGTAPAGAVNPVLDYPRSVGRTVSGGYVYRGALLPALQGTYVFGDTLGPEAGGGTKVFFANASNFSAGLTDVTAQLYTAGGNGSPRLSAIYSFGEDASGEIYVVDGGAGALYRLGHPRFFNGEIPLSNGVYYLTFPNGNLFGYYSYAVFPYLYHFDFGFIYFLDPNDGQGNIYFYDFASQTWFYSGTGLWPYMYDFTLNTFLYYFPDTNRPGRYTTNPRQFFNFKTNTVIAK